MAPHNISAIMAQMWGPMKPQCMGPNAAMLVVKATDPQSSTPTSV